MPMYDDILIRKNLGDQGFVPATGSYTSSPDIIPVGMMPVNDPQGFAERTWNQDPGVDLTANAQNYIYMRGKNLAPGAEAGNMALYYTKASLLLYPSLWLKNQLKTSSGNTLAPVKANKNGDIVVTHDPFSWIPQLIDNDHYCMVGMVGTNAHPMPTPTSETMQDLAKFLLNNPNVGWRNVRIVDNGVNFATSVDYEQGDVGGLMYVFIECAACPDGAEVSFASGTALPDSTYVQMDWEQIKGCDPKVKKHFVMGATFNIPAGWKSSITYNYKSHGKGPLQGEDWAIDIKVAFYQSSNANGAELLQFADYSDHAVHQAKGVYQGMMLGAANATDANAITPGRFIPLGSHTTKGN